MPAATTASRFCFIPSGGAALSAHSPRRAPSGCPAVGYPLQSLPERLPCSASTLSGPLKLFGSSSHIPCWFQVACVYWNVFQLHLNNAQFSTKSTQSFQSEQTWAQNAFVLINHWQSSPYKVFMKICKSFANFHDLSHWNPMTLLWNVRKANHRFRY